ncbi:MAG: ATP-dependent Clp protease proteolytic subunit [Pseudomonadota bacterium]
MTDFPNRAKAAVLMGARPNRDRARAALAGTTCRVAIKGEITDATAAAVKRQLAAGTNAGTLIVTIDSQGGDLAAAFDIFDAIRAHGAKTRITESRGATHSAAALVFASGDVRRLHPGATVLLHGAELEPQAAGRWTASRYATLAKRVAALDRGVAATIASAIGCQVETIDREMRDESLTPLARAKSIGLATELL